jgi:DNA mismatch endonuclease (patch repair protein)
MTRSENMARIRGRDTAPEKRVGAILRRLGLRYRKNVSNLPGRPDFANRRAGWAIFVHGCFWHRHPGCRRATTPRTRIDYWAPKLIGNEERDKLTQERIRVLGLKVMIIWECQTNNAVLLEALLERELI